MKARTMSRNASCSSVKIARCIDLDLHQNRTSIVLRSIYFENTLSHMAGDNRSVEEETGMSEEGGRPGSSAEHGTAESSAEHGTAESSAEHEISERGAE